MSEKFTKGPWAYAPFPEEAVDRDSQQWQVGLPSLYMAIGYRGDEYMSLSGICTEADARLIAAAPDLYAALTDLYEAIDSCVDLTPDVLRKASEALTKARGES